VLDEFGEVLHVLRFADGAPGEPRGGAGDIDLGVQPGVGSVVDEVAIAQRRVAKLDAGTLGQRVAMRDGEDQVVVADVDAGQSGGVSRSVDEGDIQLGVGGGAGEYRRGVVCEPDGDAGVGAAEGGQQGRQVYHREGLDRPNVQLAAQHAADAGHRIPALVRRGKRAAGRRQQRAAGLSKHHVPAVAHEQRDAHLAFERVDRRAEAGLDDVHPGRGPGEVQFLGDRDEMG
jgi:hypothetical protein